MDINLITALLATTCVVILVFINPILYFTWIKKIIEKKYHANISIEYPLYSLPADWGTPQIELSMFIILSKLADAFGIKYRRKRYPFRCLWQILRDEINYDYKNISLAETIFAYWVAFITITLFISIIVFYNTK